LPPACCLLLAGCATMHPGDRPPTGPVAQAQVLWLKDVGYSSDPLHEGNPVPGLAGRLFLFGPGAPASRAGDGDLLVKLYNDDISGPDGKALELEQWQIDNKTLQRLFHKDPLLGWGYSLFLPWGTCNESIKHVHLMVCFQSKENGPLYAPSGPLTLHHPERPLPPVPPRAVMQAPQAAAAAPGRP
jgi:hypothetical protein